MRPKASADDLRLQWLDVSHLLLPPRGMMTTVYSSVRLNEFRDQLGDSACGIFRAVVTDCRKKVDLSIREDLLNSGRK